MSPAHKAQIQVLVRAPKLVCAFISAPKFVCALICVLQCVPILMCAPKLVYMRSWAPKVVYALVFLLLQPLPRMAGWEGGGYSNFH